MNKKKIFGLLAAGLIAAVATTNLNLVSSEKGLSGAFLANIEALASEDDDYAPSNCWYDIEYTGNPIDKLKSCKSPVQSCSMYVSYYKRTSLIKCSSG